MIAGNDSGQRRFIVIEDFMMRELGLSGYPLLLYARIFGFSACGRDFYESKSKTASLFNTSPRTIFRAATQLVEDGLIIECGSAAKTETRTYRVRSEPLPERGRLLLARRNADSYDTTSYDATAYDDSSRDGPLAHDNLSPPLMTSCHPIRKIDNKEF